MPSASSTAPPFTAAVPVFVFKCTQHPDGSITSSGSSGDGDERASCQFDPLILANGSIYFELHIKAGIHPILGLGFAPPKYSKGMCGWYHNSCAIHADDGGIFDNDGCHTAAANFCTVGDVMGIGWERTVPGKEGEIYYTRNGKRLFNCDGIVTRKASLELLPTVSVDFNPEIAYVVNTKGPFLYEAVNSLIPME
ncbi:hypothetical protein P9112_012629 [Eukaryota sp. TZLM1-RC]